MRHVNRPLLTSENLLGVPVDLLRAGGYRGMVRTLRRSWQIGCEDIAGTCTVFRRVTEPAVESFRTLGLARAAAERRFNSRLWRLHPERGFQPQPRQPDCRDGSVSFPEVSRTGEAGWVTEEWVDHKDATQVLVRLQVLG